MSTKNSSLGNARGRGTDLIEGAAVSASTLCLVHCLALPLLLVILPGAIGLFARSDGFHYLALALVVPSAFTAFWLGHQRHGAVCPALFGLAGTGFLVVALFPGVAQEAEVWTTVAGSVLLVAGHGLNWRLRSRAA